MNMQFKKLSVILLILSVLVSSSALAQKKSTKKKSTKKTSQTTGTTDTEAQDNTAPAVVEAPAPPPPPPPPDTTAGYNIATINTEVQKLPWVQEITGKRVAMPFEPIREADVFWWKTVWRVIDTREKLNLHFRWPKAPFIQILLNSIKEGKVPVYSGVDDDFATPVDPKDALKVSGGGTDSVMVMNPVTGLQELQVITKEVDWNNVKKFRVKEIWYFNKQTSTMEVRILGICPLMDNYTVDPLTGDEVFRGEIPLFYAYFPSLRPILVNSEAFNPFPDGNRLNWDQVFALRLFSSYIFKVDNVQDRRIKDYKSGIDILYESEAKKQDLFNFEHDLWEY